MYCLSIPYIALVTAVAVEGMAQAVCMSASLVTLAPLFAEEGGERPLVPRFRSGLTN